METRFLAEAENSSEAEELCRLARSRFASLSPADEHLFRSAASGRIADFSEQGGARPVHDSPTLVPSERMLSSDRLTWLCSNTEANRFITHKGLRINGACISGMLDLEDLQFPHVLALRYCTIPDEIYMKDSSLRILSLSGSFVGSLCADRLNVDGTVFLNSGFKCNGELSLSGARIGGDVRCANAQLNNPSGSSLEASFVDVRGNVILSNVSSNGKICFDAAHIAGNYFCSGELRNDIDDALSAERIKVDGSINFGRELNVEGRLNFTGARLGGDFRLTDQIAIHSAPEAVTLERADVEGSVVIADQVRVKGQVALRGTRIRGEFKCLGNSVVATEISSIDADRIRVASDVTFGGGVNTEGPVSFFGAKIGGDIALANTSLVATDEAFRAGSISVGGNLFLGEDFRVNGKVSLTKGDIGGRLECYGARLVNRGGVALQGDELQTGASVILGEDLEVEGEIRLPSAKIGGSVLFRGCRLKCVNGDAINADSAVVRGNLFFRNKFVAEGTIKLLGIRVEGDVELGDTRFVNPDDVAILASRATIEGSVYIGPESMIQGGLVLASTEIQNKLVLAAATDDSTFELDLRACHVGELFDRTDSWPAKGRLHLAGFVYEQFGSGAEYDAKTRANWLERLDDRSCELQPYEQLAEVLKKSGEWVDARKILILKEKRRKQKGKLTIDEWLWFHLIGPLIGYGHRPLRALIPACIIVALGAAFFSDGRAYIVPTQVAAANSPGTYDSGTHPSFNPIMYSLDAFIPLVDFHQLRYRLPQNDPLEGPYAETPGLIRTGNGLLWWLWFEIAAGWVISTILVVGITRFNRN